MDILAEDMELSPSEGPLDHEMNEAIAWTKACEAELEREGPARHLQFSAVGQAEWAFVTVSDCESKSCDENRRRKRVGFHDHVEVCVCVCVTKL